MLPSKSLRHAILAQVHRQPMHGYRLRQLAHRLSWIYPITNSPIYPVLHELEQEGMLTHSTEIHRGRVRKIYRLTERGEQQLSQWLNTAPDDELEFSDPVAFKVAAHNDEALEDSTQWMRGTIARLRGKVEEHERDLAQASEPTEYSHLAVAYGVEMLRLRVRLLEQALALAERKSDARATRGPILQSVGAQ